jgi:hypothetical protein
MRWEQTALCAACVPVCVDHMKTPVRAQAFYLSLSLSLVSKTCCNQVIFEIIYTLAQPGHFREAFAWQFYALFDLRRLRTSSKNNYGHGACRLNEISAVSLLTSEELTARSCGGLLINVCEIAKLTTNKIANKWIFLRFLIAIIVVLTNCVWWILFFIDFLVDFKRS